MKVGPCQYSQMREAALIQGVSKLEDSKQPESIVPFRLVFEPACLKKQTYEKLKYASELWQQATYKASLNPEFIFEALKDCHFDPLIGPLLEIYREVVERERDFPKPKIELYRYDYFIESQTKDIKLIQFNSHAVSMAGISSRFQKVSKDFFQHQIQLQQNQANNLYADGIKNFYDENSLDGILLFVFQPFQKNINDQKYTIQAIEAHGIKIKKVLLSQLQPECYLDDKGDLYFQNQKVSVVYFRAGYTLQEHNEIVWKGKRKVHLSNAVSIPSISVELMNKKRIQSELSKEKIYKEFLEEKDYEMFSESIIDTWDFDGSQNVEKFLEMMEKQGKQNFILKPNEEGGSNNFFGEEAFEKFKCLASEERPNYILTRKITPEKCMCTFISEKGSTCCCNGTHQISIYGCISSKYNQAILRNHCDGFLVRTKPEDTNECGLLMGSGALSALKIQ